MNHRRRRGDGRRHEVFERQRAVALRGLEEPGHVGSRQVPDRVEAARVAELVEDPREAREIEGRREECLGKHPVHYSAFHV
ncbi:MAG: hypothetical protein IPG50_00860 [Myxococcales bacterium]|nr:hypothetical protein [Myxococcales bacterium]